MTAHRYRLGMGKLRGELRIFFKNLLPEDYRASRANMKKRRPRRAFSDGYRTEINKRGKKPAFPSWHRRRSSVSTRSGKNWAEEIDLDQGSTWWRAPYHSQ